MPGISPAQRSVVTDTTVLCIDPGHRWVGTQLPIQAQSSLFVAEWERSASPEDLAQVAQTCEVAGFDYVGVCDHIAIPERAASSMGTHWMDPIATLSWLAAKTKRIHLLTHVYVLPYRHARVAAKQLSAIDHLSEGRLVAGIGAGHLAEEFALLNLDFSSRGRVMDERLPQLILALENEFVAGFGASPRPTQHPRPPIWVAGSSAPAIRRAVEVGDGWLPQGPATPRLVKSVKDRLERAHRPVDGFAIGHIAPPIHLGTPGSDVGKYTITGSPSGVADQLLSSMPTDVNQIQVRVMANSLDEYCNQLSWAGAELLPLLR